MSDIDVLVAGGGPVGLTAAIELRRRGVEVRIVDPLLEPPQYAKAVGVQPRTLEVYEGMGVLRQMLDAAVEMQGPIAYVNGEQVARLDIAVPRELPFGFMLMPQRGRRIRGAVHARRRRGGLVAAAQLRCAFDAPDRRQDRRPPGVHPNSRPGPLPHVDARARRTRPRLGRRGRGGTRVRGAAHARAVPHSGRAGPPVAGAGNGLGHALVVGVPDQPPGYLGYRGPVDDAKALIDHLQRTFAPVSS